MAQNSKTAAVSRTLSEGSYLPNRIIVKFKEDGSSQTKTLSTDKLISVSSATIESITQKFPTLSRTKTGASTLKIQDKFGLNRIYELRLSGKETLEKTLDELRANDKVEYAEPVYIHHADFTPVDSLYSVGSQNYLNQVRAPQAWDLVRNNPKVIIAIVDSGSDLDHIDLAANIYLNTADPINGIDDDGDGFIDNFRGWDFVGASEDNIVEDPDPNIISAAADHGAHVSGIASAVTNNIKGGASIAYNCAKLMIIKTASDVDGTSIVRGYEGIKYAADHGAHIINCSWGSENLSYFGQDIINYAINKGCLIVSASGNNGGNVPQYPAGYAGVMAVANVNSNDEKNGSSNYGPYISISAPGTDIWSTSFNTYDKKTGTSMASPVVASAAALVKTYFPNLTMQQVGEVLRITSDNIDSKNPAFINQLGKGRLNVYRALTESSPSIKRQSIVVTDQAGGTFPEGDTLTIYASFKNFLNPVNNLKITLKTNEDYLVVTQPEVIIANLGTLATQSNVGPFKVYIKPGAPDNYSAELRFEYSATANSYTDFEGFTIQLNRDYLNLRTNNIATTVTSKGSIGFLQGGGEEGTLGFQFKGEQLLYEGALMIGNSEMKVSNNARSSDSGADDHFQKQVRVRAIINADTTRAEAAFDDSGSPNPLNIYVTQRSLVVKNDATSNYLITEYEVENTNDYVLNNVYIGTFNDWDINGGALNATKYDKDKNIAYAYDRSSSTFPYAAIKLISSANPAYYPLSNRLSGNLLANDNFSIAEKYTALSSGVSSAEIGTGNSGTDVSFVVGYGPYSIPPKKSVKAAFAYIGAANIPDAEATAALASTVYQNVKLDLDPAIDNVTLYSYYSELEQLPYVAINLPERANISIDLYNHLGQKVKNVRNGMFVKGEYHFPVFNTDGLANGVYFFALNANGKISTFKTTFLR